jgi:hypothetical protein
MPLIEAGILVGFVHGGELSSRFIGCFGGSYYCHVTTLLPDGANVIDSRLGWGAPDGVQVRPLSYLYPPFSAKGSRVAWYQLDCQPAQALTVYRLLHSQLNKPYDRIGIINFMTCQMRNRNWRSEAAWFCDELAVWTWERAGICRPFIDDNLSPSRITPGGAAMVAIQSGARRVHPPFEKHIPLNCIEP